MEEAESKRFSKETRKECRVGKKPDYQGKSTGKEGYTPSDSIHH